MLLNSARPTSFGSQGFSGRGSRSSSSSRRSGRLKAILHHPIQDYARQDFSTFMTIQKSKVWLYRYIALLVWTLYGDTETEWAPVLHWVIPFKTLQFIMLHYTIMYLTTLLDFTITGEPLRLGPLFRNAVTPTPSTFPKRLPSQWEAKWEAHCGVSLCSTLRSQENTAIQMGGPTAGQIGGVLPFFPRGQ